MWGENAGRGRKCRWQFVSKFGYTTPDLKGDRGETNTVIEDVDVFLIVLFSFSGTSSGWQQTEENPEQGSCRTGISSKSSLAG